MTAQNKIESKFALGLHICVGLDPDIDKMPVHLLKSKNPIFEFNKQLIDNTYKHAAAYKLNLAFFEKYGKGGWETLLETIEYVPKDILVIGDAKRGDIANSSKMYVESLYDHLKFDSVTLNPYMGYDSLEPFLKLPDKINFILALTSNPGAIDFEKLLVAENTYLFQRVIDKVKSWNKLKNCGIVFGATNKDELDSNQNSFDDLYVLLPGIGVQGGSLEGVVNSFRNNNSNRFLINVSRGIIYADSSKSFASKAGEVLIRYNAQIASLNQ